jgi:hypothetical protein
VRARIWRGAFVVDAGTRPQIVTSRAADERVAPVSPFEPCAVTFASLSTVF